ARPGRPRPPAAPLGRRRTRHPAPGPAAAAPARGGLGRRALPAGAVRRRARRRRPRRRRLVVRPRASRAAPRRAAPRGRPAAGGPAERGELDREPQEYPLITATQRAGDVDELGEPWPAGAVVEAPARPTPSLDEVILRRGSTRLMDREAEVARELLDWPLAV